MSGEEAWKRERAPGVQYGGVEPWRSDAQKKEDHMARERVLNEKKERDRDKSILQAGNAGWVKRIQDGNLGPPGSRFHNVLTGTTGDALEAAREWGRGVRPDQTEAHATAAEKLQRKNFLKRLGEDQSPHMRNFKDGIGYIDMRALGVEHSNQTGAAHTHVMGKHFQEFLKHNGNVDAMARAQGYESYAHQQAAEEKAEEEAAQRDRHEEEAAQRRLEEEAAQEEAAQRRREKAVAKSQGYESYAQMQEAHKMHERLIDARMAASQSSDVDSSALSVKVEADGNTIVVETFKNALVAETLLDACKQARADAFMRGLMFVGDELSLDKTIDDHGIEDEAVMRLVESESTADAMKALAAPFEADEKAEDKARFDEGMARFNEEFKVENKEEKKKVEAQYILLRDLKDLLKQFLHYFAILLVAILVADLLQAYYMKENPLVMYFFK